MDYLLPRLKPVSNDTWEVTAALAGNQEETERDPIELPFPARIVGFYPSVILNGVSTNLLIPDTNDIMVNLDANQQRRFTNRLGQTTQAIFGNSFVTLEAMNTRYRDLMIELLNSRPTLGIQFRWKRWDDAFAASPIYADCLVSLALFAQDMRGQNNNG